MKWRPISASVIAPCAAISAIVLILPAHLGAQWTDLSTHWPDLSTGWIDGRLPRRGELQIGLSGQVSTLESRFMADGTKQPLSDVFAVDLNDPLLVPELVALDSTLVDLFSSLGLSEPEPSGLGLISYDVQIEKQRLPITITFGLTDWLAAHVAIPVIRGKSFVGVRLDSAATAGLAGTAFGGNPDAFFQDLNARISELEAIIAADTLPTDRRAQAEALVSSARTLETGLSEMPGLEYAASDSGANGRELQTFYADLSSGFQDFQIPFPTLNLASLPDEELVSGLSSGPEFGIDPLLGRDTGIKFGDIELGISLQPINTFRGRADGRRPKVPIRARLDGLFRFPTGGPPAANRVTDPGVGDGQPDLEFRSTVDLAIGRRFWLSAFAGYNIQRERELERLITSTELPIQPGAFVAPVTWNPGDVLTLTAAPRFNFTRHLTFAASYSFVRHGRDQYELLGANPSPSAPFTADDLEEGTEYSVHWLGLIARYSPSAGSEEGRPGRPVEAELRYRRSLSGSRGFAPDLTVWEVAMRFYPAPFR